MLLLSESFRRASAGSGARPTQDTSFFLYLGLMFGDRSVLLECNSTLHDSWLMVDDTPEGGKKALVVHSMLGHHLFASLTRDDPTLNGPRVLFYRPQTCNRPSTTCHEALN